jgi:hypothetical protein
VEMGLYDVEVVHACSTACGYKVRLFSACLQTIISYYSNNFIPVLPQQMVCNLQLQILQQIVPTDMTTSSW